MSETPEFSNLDQSLQIDADPSRYNFLYSLKVSKDVIRRLSLHLDRTVVGSKEVFLSPIGKEEDPSITLSKFDKIFENNLGKMNKILLDLEYNNRGKYGPRSIAKPWSERRKSLVDYFSASTSTRSLVLKSINNGRLRPLSLEEGIKLLKNNTNSGLPYYTRKSKVKMKTLEHFKDEINAEYPCILFTRTQEGGKTRNVWGYPMSDTLNEMLYYSPILNFQKRLVWRAALLGPDLVDRAITALVSSAIDGKILYSVDFSAYDASINSYLEDLSFDYIKSCFQSVYHENILKLRDRFKTIGIITPNGIMSGQHGVPSGSTFTNEVDSLVQYIISSNSGVKDSQMQIQGDDGAYCVDVDTLDILKDNFKHYGLKLNDEKSHTSQNYLVYLQKLYHKDYLKDGLIGGIYPVYRALCRIVFQERYSDFEDYDLKGIDYYSIRTITILENCKYHPLFKELVRFVYDLDKYKLKFSQDAIGKYGLMLNNSTGTGNLLYNQYGDKVGGINDFETVKYLRHISNRRE